MKNIILKSITGLAFMAMITAASFMDSKSNIPAIVLVIALGWLGMFALANRDHEQVRKDSRYEK